MDVYSRLVRVGGTRSQILSPLSTTHIDMAEARRIIPDNAPILFAGFEHKEEV